jgi:hypothetical protein
MIKWVMEIIMKTIQNTAPVALMFSLILVATQPAFAYLDGAGLFNANYLISASGISKPDFV